MTNAVLNSWAPITATAVAAGLLAFLGCKANKSAPTGVLAGLGVGSLTSVVGAFLASLSSLDPSIIPDLLAGAVDQALAAMEGVLRAVGLGVVADAIGQARSLFNDLKAWADATLGEGGRLLLGLFLIYLVYQRFFLRR